MKLVNAAHDTIKRTLFECTDSSDLHAVQRCLKAVSGATWTHDVCFAGFRGKIEAVFPNIWSRDPWREVSVGLDFPSAWQQFRRSDLEIYMRLTFLMFHCDLNWKTGASSYANAFASGIALLCINRPRFSTSCRALRTSEAETRACRLDWLFDAQNLHHIGRQSFVPGWIKFE